MKKYWQIYMCLAIAAFVLTSSVVLAQTAGQTKIDITFHNTPLKKALEQLQSKTALNFVFSEEMVKKIQVSLQAKNMSVTQILDQLLNKTDLDYLIKDNKIIIRKNTGKAAQAPPKSISMTSMGRPGITRIKGSVFNKDDLPIPGVNISFKEVSTTFTRTNEKGEYSIAVVPNARTLVFRHLGYLTKEVSLNSGGEIDVVLEPEEKNLQSVVVTGVFTRKAESFTGSAATFTAEQLRNVGNQNILQSLKVLDPSFIQVENLDMGSNPNSLPDIQIRGANSLPDVRGEYAGNPNLPLFILDGFESSLEKIYDLDMNRVASVTILKDAAAKAVYGSRAANGVVVVETKRPQMGKLRLSYTGDMNLTTPDLSSYQLTNATEKLQAELDAGRYSSPYYYSDQFLKEQYNINYTEVARGVNTYWLSKPVQNAVGQKHTLSLEGGDTYLRYGGDFTYNSIAGSMKESGRRTVSGNLFLSYRLSKFLFRNNLMVTGNYAYDSPYGAFTEYSRLNPYWSPTESNGTLRKVLGQFSTGSGTPISYFNPLYNASIGTKNFSKYTDITNNFQTEWSLSDVFKVVGRFGFTHRLDSREDFYPANHTRFALYAAEDFFRRGQYSIDNGRDGSIKTDLTLNYTKSIGKNLFLLNGGLNLYETQRETNGMIAEGFLNDRVDNISFARQYLQDSRPSGTDAITRETGFFSALNYSYNERYLADLTFRRQGSSVFGADNRWGNFWSAGIGWNLHREAFLSDKEWLSQLKLRASTGYTGSQNFNPYQAMATYSYFTDVYYDNIVGARLLGLANDELKWQQTRDYNFGIDAQLLSRINLRLDYYISNTNSLLTDLSLPGSVGFSSIKENLGQVRNNGIDAVISFKAINKPSTNSFLNVFVNLGMNKNKLVKISDALNSLNDEQEAERGTSTRPFTRFQEGKSTTAIWAVPSAGIDPVTGAELFVNKAGELTYTWNPNDQVAFGDSNPKLRGSFGFNGQYKGFGLNCSLSYKVGGQYYNQTLVDRVENVDIQYNTDTRVFTDTWKNPGDVVFFKRITSSPTRTNPTSRFVQDLNELQLSSVNAYYDFRNKAFLKRSGLDRLRLTVFSNEIARIATVKAERGLSYPFAHTYSCSVQATF